MASLFVLRGPEGRTRMAKLAILPVLVVFGLPLFAGLGNKDMQNDEAIYSYAVERILDTGEWLTPRSIPSDTPFLEKPPLKFWMVAAPMAAGLVPRTDMGMRLLDAMFGVLAFAYVYWLGVRLAGTVCGVAAVLVLFAFEPIVIYGFRANHMDGTLVLAYCGGIFHFVRWMEASRQAVGRREALLVSLYFVLGFMTKFVAAIFLPMICAAALILHPEALARIRATWRDWLAPALMVVVLVMPWFAYQTLQRGTGFWEILVGQHVYARFTDSLDPTHLAPWHHYFTQTWRELGHADGLAIALLGMAALVPTALRRDGWLASVMLLWFLLPYTLLSFGTSKLLHYAFPFVPPIAIGAGYGFALVLRALGTEPAMRVGADVRRRVSDSWIGRTQVRHVLTALGVAAIGLAVWTAIGGPLVVEMDDVRVFRNSSVLRPAFVALVCFAFAGVPSNLGLVGPAVALLVFMPIERYTDLVVRIITVDAPVRTVRDCVVTVQGEAPETGRGVLRASDNVLHHEYFYYLRHAGTWEIVDPPSEEAVIARILEPVGTTPVLVTAAQYRAISSRLMAPQPPATDSDPALLSQARDPRRAGALLEENVVVLLPGPFEACIPVALETGARPLPHGTQ